MGRVPAEVTPAVSVVRPPIKTGEKEPIAEAQTKEAEEEEEAAPASRETTPALRSFTPTRPMVVPKMAQVPVSVMVPRGASLLPTLFDQISKGRETRFNVVNLEF